MLRGRVFMKCAAMPISLSVQYDDAISDYVTAYNLIPITLGSCLCINKSHRCQYKKHAYKETIESINRLLNVAQQDGLGVEDYRVYETIGRSLLCTETL